MLREANVGHSIDSIKSSNLTKIKCDMHNVITTKDGRNSPKLGETESRADEEWEPFPDLPRHDPRPKILQKMSRPVPERMEPPN